MTLRLMLLGDIIWGTSGYSKIVANTSQLCNKLGHSVAHVPMGKAMRGGKFSYKNTLIYPAGNDPWGEDVILSHYVDYNTDLLITVKDVWVFNNIHKWALNWCPIVPVDHKLVSGYITGRLNTCFKVIAISRFGQRELRHKHVDNVEYIPLSVNTKIYKPLEGKKDECKKLFYLKPGSFDVGIVAMNRVRKMIPRMLRGYKRFLELNPGIKSNLWLWTPISPVPQVTEENVVLPGAADSGVNLIPEIMELGLGQRAVWPQWSDVQKIGGLPEWNPDPNYRGGWDMVKMYNAMDVLFGCTGGEGFWLPGIEAQACGTPVIVTDYAAAPEICGAGLTVKWDDYIIIRSPGTKLVLPSIDGMANALTKIYNADKQKLAKRARKFAMRYSIEKIAEKYWKPFLMECEQELKPLITKGGNTTW